MPLTVAAPLSVMVPVPGVPFTVMRAKLKKALIGCDLGASRLAEHVAAPVGRVEPVGRGEELLLALGQALGKALGLRQRLEPGLHLELGRLGFELEVVLLERRLALGKALGRGTQLDEWLQPTPVVSFGWYSWLA